MYTVRSQQISEVFSWDCQETSAKLRPLVLNLSAPACSVNRRAACVRLNYLSLSRFVHYV